MQVSMTTGLRVSDVLGLKTAQLRQSQRVSVRELKTGKTRRVWLPRELYDEMLEQAGRLWVFEGRTDWRKPRCRSAVYKDVKRAAGLFRASGVVPRNAQISPHTARKVAAVDVMHKTGDLEAVARKLNHSDGDREVTALYALADVLTARKLGGR